VVQEAWSFPGGPSGSESSLVSQHASPFLVDTTVIPMQSSVETPLLLGGDVSLDLFVSHSIQPMAVSMQSSVDPTLLLESDKSKEVTLSMQSLVNTTLLLGGDASFDHVLIISSYVPSEQEIFPIS
jgi:hypothetical protein